MSEQPKSNAMVSLEAQIRLDTLKNLFPVILDEIKMNAKLRKAKYDALVDEGFSSEQAIEIISKSKILE